LENEFAVGSYILATVALQGTQKTEPFDIDTELNIPVQAGVLENEFSVGLYILATVAENGEQNIEPLDNNTPPIMPVHAGVVPNVLVAGFPEPPAPIP
jgi:hypothetical protein